MVRGPACTWQAIRTFNTHMFHFGLRKQPGSGTIMHRNNGEHEVLTFTVDVSARFPPPDVPQAALNSS